MFQLAIINAMNNNAASSLASGQHEMEAIELLRESLDVLSDMSNNTSKESSGEEEMIHPKFNSIGPPIDGTFVSPIVNTIHHGLSYPSDSFIYNNGLVLTLRGSACDDRDIAIMSATVIYNMALAHHRMALSSPKSQFRGGWIFKATTFYQQAIELSLIDIQLVQQRNGGVAGDHHHDATITIAMASYNNLGQINFDLLSDHDAARRCFESLSYLIQCSRLLESQEKSPFTPEDWEGILSNLAFVTILTATVAAAA
jgi:hypothetical protein